MKKLLKVSMVAMLVAAPFAANATLPAAYSDGSTSTKPTVAAVADVASTSYVKGAYDTAISYINELNTAKLDASTAASTYATQTALTDGLATKQDTIDSTHKVSADLIDDSTSTNKFVTAAEKTAIANAITKDVNDLTNYTTTTDMNAALATKQDASKSTVATGTYNYITQGDGVATNLVSLDTAAKNAKDAADTAESHIGTLSGLSTTTKTDVVSAINEVAATAATNKYVTVHTTWGNDNATQSANVLTTTAPAQGGGN